MKKKICFVGFADDQPDASNSLKAAAAGVSAVWDSTFVPNGASALAALSSEPFDAVVTNMRMNGMNGAELLQQVGSLHPKALRFVLGNVADQELIINCIGGTHHFIAQPCKPEAVISSIQRGLSLDAWLSSDQLRALIPKLRRLPTLPLTYFEVLKQVESPNASVQSIGEVIARDPAATARLLQMVNSAAFALDQKVTDPVHAVSLLGLETVKSLVLCLQVFSPNDQAKKAGLSFDQLWDHSFAVAKAARDLTALQTGDARTANEAFTAGLLHDVGRIVLASNLPEDYAEVVSAARQNSRSLSEEEGKRFGVTHAQAGAYLLGLWGMPAPVIEAAALHHTPSHTFTREFSLLTVVHIANVFAHEQDSRNDGLPFPELDHAYVESLQLTDKTAAWRKMIVGDKPAPAASKPAPSAPSTTATATAARPAPAPSKPAPVAAPAEPRPNPVVAAPTPVAAAASTAQSPAHRSWVGKFLIPAVAVTSVAALLSWITRLNTKDHVQAKVPAVEVERPAPARPRPVSKPPVSRAARRPAVNPSATNNLSSTTNAPAAPRPAFDSVRVQAIFYHPSRPTAMINGKTLAVGERINGLQVVSIGQSNVVLAFGQERKDFPVKAK